MKKYAVFLLALCLLLSLCACRAEDSENLFGTAAPTEAPPAQPSGTALPTDATALVSGGDEDCGIRSRYIAYGGRVLFEELMNGRWQFLEYDPETGELSQFCKDATCSHGEKGCNSANIGVLELYNGKLYGSKSSLSGPENTLVELKDGRFEQALDGSVNGFWHAYGNLYVETADGSLIVYPRGSTKSRMLVEEYTDPFYKIHGDYLYGNGYTFLTRVDLTAETPAREVIMGGDYDGPEKSMQGTVGAKIDGEYIYYINYSDYYLRRCKLDCSEPELLLEMAVGPASLMCDDPGYIYFAANDWDDHHIYRISKTDPTDVMEIAELPRTPWVFTLVPEYDLLFVEVRMDEGDSGSGIYVVNVNSGEWKELELSNV